MMSKRCQVNCSTNPGRPLMSSAIGSVGSRLRARLAASIKNRRVPTRWSGMKLSSLATEWVITDGWLRAALIVRSTWASARRRSIAFPSRLAPWSRCHTGAWFHTMIPAWSRRRSRGSLST